MRPSFVFILADDLGYADLGCYGGRAPCSPELDRMASDGLRFTEGYANSPVCSPTRFALMTGRFQYRLRGGNDEPIASRHRGSPVLGLPPGHPTLPSLLRAAERRRAIGVWQDTGVNDRLTLAGSEQTGWQWRPPIVFVGVVVLIGWVVCLRTTLRSIGGLSLLLANAFLAALFWLFADWGWLPVDNVAAISWLDLLSVTAILTVGMSWSRLRRGAGAAIVTRPGPERR